MTTKITTVDHNHVISTDIHAEKRPNHHNTCLWPLQRVPTTTDNTDQLQQPTTNDDEANHDDDDEITPMTTVNSAPYLSYHGHEAQ